MKQLKILLSTSFFSHKPSVVVNHSSSTRSHDRRFLQALNYVRWRSATSRCFWVIELGWTEEMDESGSDWNRRHKPACCDLPQFPSH
ncbi:hypothetical protein Q7C36_005078 [Tachysurus vachellii]|uniref:Uncharacterized protein n=1 Tax=Tachysurus vachellii TaxID=175792 RepID=A0AA88T4Q3_TACVA|nr:hypothetical protein Q7C36_005078 [Tachysurus vachellii]